MAARPLIASWMGPRNMGAEGAAATGVATGVATGAGVDSGVGGVLPGCDDQGW